MSDSLICPWCGKEFKPGNWKKWFHSLFPGLTNRLKYCSRLCRLMAEFVTSKGRKRIFR